MVSSATALEQAALKNGLSLKKMAHGEDDLSLKNGTMTDESSQNSTTSDKAQNGTNGDHKKEESVVIDDDDEDIEVQEFSEPEELIIDEDEPDEDDTAEEDAKEEPMDEDEENKSSKAAKEEPGEQSKSDLAECSASTSKDGAAGAVVGDKAIEKNQENDENLPNIPIVKDVRKLDKGLPTFMQRRVKIGRWTPCKMPTGSGEFKMRDTEALVDVPSMSFPLLIKEKDTFARRIKEGKTLPPKPRKAPVPPQGQFKIGQTSVVDFFASSAGEFLMELGLDRVQEAYNKDQIKQKEREMRRQGKSAELLETAKKHAEAFQAYKAKNAAFHHKMKRCQTCDFKTESQLVLEGHLLTPHFTQRRELQCSFCPFITRDAKAIIFHMEAHHNKIPVMEPPPQFYECPFCPFETNVKNKAGTHVNRCQRYFNNNVNQSPGNDFQAPGMTSKPITNEDIKMYEKFFIALTQAKNQAAAHAVQAANTAQQRQLMMAAAAGRGNTIRGGSNALYQQLQTLAAATAANRAAQAAVGRGSHRNNSQANLIQQAQALAYTSQAASLLNGNNGLSVTALNAQNRATASASLARIPQPGVPTGLSAPGTGRAPYILESSGQGGANSQGAAGAFVICEICDGYIKDLDELRSHMHWIHKVKIHPKMLASRPPLNCQKCKWRFFTDQGLERHLLGAHGLVTSNMQELAQNGQDGGRCTVCGRIYASKLVAHMSQVHRVAVKPASLSYKCTVCTAVFNLYRLFESHVYSVHSGAMKRGSSSDQNTAKRRKEDRKDDTAAATGGSSKSRDESNYPKTCALCNDLKVDDWCQHLAEKHMPKNVKVGVCRIEKCNSCLNNFDGMVVMNSDLGESSSSEDEED